MGLRSFNVSDWGFFRFVGPDAREFLQGLTTADTRALVPGVMLPACVLSPKGKLIADCELYQETPEIVLAVTRPAAAVGFLAAFDKKIMLSRSTLKVLRSETVWLVIGEGFERGLPWNRLAEPARLLLGVDPPEEAEMLSPGEFQALRVAAGFPWYGADMDAENLPLEARQEAAISMDKGCYMGQETVSRIVHMGKVNKILVGLRTDTPAGAPLKRGGVEVGRVTSSAGGLGLGMVKTEDAEPGTVFDAAEIRAVPSWPASLSRRSSAA